MMHLWSADLDRPLRLPLGSQETHPHRRTEHPVPHVFSGYLAFQARTLKIPWHRLLYLKFLFFLHGHIGTSLDIESPQEIFCLFCVINVDTFRCLYLKWRAGFWFFKVERRGH